MFGVGPQELLVVLIIALLVFGPKKMPEIGKSLGSFMRELRRSSNDFMSALESNDEPDEDVAPEPVHEPEVPAMQASYEEPREPEKPRRRRKAVTAETVEPEKGE